LCPQGPFSNAFPVLHRFETRLSPSFAAHLSTGGSVERRSQDWTGVSPIRLFAARSMVLFNAPESLDPIFAFDY
jgi:hypothetical protein